MLRSFKPQAGPIGWLALITCALWPLAAAAAPTASGEVVATAQGQTAPPPAAPASTPIQTTDPTPDADPVAATPDRKPHGVVEVGIGTGGYRHVAGEVTAPVGDGGQVTIAVDQNQGRARWR